MDGYKITDFFSLIYGLKDFAPPSGVGFPLWSIGQKKGRVFRSWVAHNLGALPEGFFPFSKIGPCGGITVSIPECLNEKTFQVVGEVGPQVSPWTHGQPAVGAPAKRTLAKS